MILQQNPERYSKRGNDYVISAGEEIEPLKITPLDRDIRLEPLLPADIKGVIIHLKGYNRYLTSPSLFNELTESIKVNPHWNWKRHSEVLGVRMGRTIPIIPIDIDSVVSIISEQTNRIANAGVKQIEWGISDNDISGIIKQIAWTLSPSAGKPADSYTIYDLNIDADYTIASSVESELEIQSRISALNRDFNRIKDLFYFRKTDSTAATKFTTIASSEEDSENIQVVTKQVIPITNRSEGALMRQSGQSGGVLNGVRFGGTEVV